MPEAKFSGKIYSSSGIRHDPHRIQRLMHMGKPANVAELMRFLCALN